MEQSDKKELVEQSTDVALSAAGALVGFALSGPMGALTGGIFHPMSKLAMQVGLMWWQRRKKRLTHIVEKGFERSGKSDGRILKELQESPTWCDGFMSMVEKLIDSNPELDVIFSEIIAYAIKTDEESEKNRWIVLMDSLKGLNRVQVLILKDIYISNNVLSAHDISEFLRVPEVELRNAVRDLELRGMIEDNGTEPTVWRLRELGIAVARTIYKISKTEVEHEDKVF